MGIARIVNRHQLRKEKSQLTGFCNAHRVIYEKEYGCPVCWCTKVIEYQGLVINGQTHIIDKQPNRVAKGGAECL